MGAAGGTFLYRNCGKDATAALPHSQGGMTVECITQWNKGKFPAMHRLAGNNPYAERAGQMSY